MGKFIRCKLAVKMLNSIVLYADVMPGQTHLSFYLFEKCALTFTGLID